jgi:hypothetical protein
MESLRKTKKEEVRGERGKWENGEKEKTVKEGG